MDRQTDRRMHSYNPLQLYEGGLKGNSAYVNLKELPKSILRSNDLQGDRHGSTGYQSRMYYGLSVILF